MTDDLRPDPLHEAVPPGTGAGPGFRAGRVAELPSSSEPSA